MPAGILVHKAAPEGGPPNQIKLVAPTRLEIPPLCYMAIAHAHSHACSARLPPNITYRDCRNHHDRDERQHKRAGNLPAGHVESDAE